MPNVVSPKLPPGELEAIIAIVDPKLIIGLTPREASGRAALAGGPSHRRDILRRRTARGRIAQLEGDDEWRVHGPPKVIIDAMPGRWDPQTTVFGQLPDDSLLNPGPLHHNAPFIGMHYGLFTGATVVEMGKFDAERALALIDGGRPGGSITCRP